MVANMQMRLNACRGIGLAVVLLAILIAEGRADADMSLSSCLNQLVPCLNYLDSGTSRDPPSNCCNPLKWVIKSSPECLCNMISIKGSNAAEEAGINVTQAQELPGRCGQAVNPISCLKGSPNSKNSVSNSASFSFCSLSTTVAAALSLVFQAVYMGF
ncbi:non-specific lipid transfer protein GPI-anchored 30 isoform X2 [Rhododendron vialii]|uniref:non-specific lipid transfer protein GPI-anchored 30 isoform X2 n=1 Tax=Rhododendron vialii TaxID=182163 RepID=UPI00265E1C13|nr:non-specific lipid transfer protein GPI-anchored 30 isoform X2 [Rhododendron vialii]